MFSKDQKRLIELINEKYNANQISEKLGITNLQLYKRITNIENKGYLLTREYYSDGNILYVPGNKNLFFQSSILTNPEEKSINVLVVSDPHLGTKKEGLAQLDRAYNYSVKHGIHFVFNCGDLVEGTFGQNVTKFKDPVKQADYLVKKYPHDDSIITFGVLGNHDVSLIKHCDIDLRELLRSYRHDIVINSTELGRVNIKEDSITLFHKINSCYSNKNDNSSVVLNGHFHNAKFYPFGSVPGKTVIDVPAMCYFDDNMPSAVKLKIKFKNNMIKRVEANQILFLDKDYEINEIDYDFPNRKPTGQSKGIMYKYKFTDHGRVLLDSNDDKKKDENAENLKRIVYNEKYGEVEVLDDFDVTNLDSEENEVPKKSTSELMKEIDFGMNLKEQSEILEELYGEKTKPKKTKKKVSVPEKLELTNDEKIALLINDDSLTLTNNDDGITLTDNVDSITLTCNNDSVILTCNNDGITLTDNNDNNIDIESNNDVVIVNGKVVKTKSKTRMSQIEKFNSKYGLK